LNSYIVGMIAVSPAVYVTNASENFVICISRHLLRNVFSLWTSCIFSKCRVSWILWGDVWFLFR